MPKKIPDLHLGGRAAEDVSDLQILQHLARHRRGDADHGCYSEHRGNSAGSRNAERDHEQRCDHQRAQRESRDWIVGRSDHADEVAGNGSEEKSDDDHDAGCDQSEPD